MAAASLGPVPVGCRERLIGHYGPAAEVWLNVAPSLLAQAAERWGLRVERYHDAGHSSVLAVANSPDQGSVLLKAWYDRTRYAHETTALTTWRHGPPVRLRATAPDLAIAALDLVGGQPGGQTPPEDEYRAVAAGINRLHTVSADGTCLPTLVDYLSREVMPRIESRVLGSH